MYMSNSRSKVPEELLKLGVRNMNITKLKHTTGHALTKLPPQIGDLKKLEYLFLGFNKLTTLPPQIGNLENLRVLHLNNNNLKSLPSTIGKLEKLEKLDLSDNVLESLPPQIGLCKNLKKLNLDNNKLKTLPKEIIKLRNISIIANRNPNLTIPYILKNKNITVFNHYLSTDPNVFYEKKYNYTNYYKNQLAVINKKRNNLPYLPRNIKNIIAKQVSNVEPVTKPKPPSKTKNPLRKLVRKIKDKSKLKRNTENIKKVTNRIKNTVKTPNKPNTPNTIRKKAGNAAQSRRTNRK
tara:strand:- start:152 stop:1033 length:882 start_codon:yes stop_codon:yes gene_type:complete